VDEIVAALHDGNREVRCGAILALYCLGDRRAVGPLVAVLRDGDRYDRIRAALALEDLGDPAAIPALTAAAADGPIDLRRTAAHALASLGSPRPMAELLADLEEGDRYQRDAAAEALGRLGNPQAAAPLLAALRARESEVRGAAAAALGRIGRREAVPALAEMMKTDRDPIARVKAATALAEIGGPIATAALLAEVRHQGLYGPVEIVLALSDVAEPREGDAIVPLLARRDRGPRITAALALAALRRAEGVPVLREALGAGPQAWSRAGVVGLARLGTPQARQALREGAPAIRNPDVRRLAARCLETSLSQALVEELSRQEGNVSHAAACYLNYVGQLSALPALDQVAVGGNPCARDAARTAARHIRRMAERTSTAPSSRPAATAPAAGGL
jgi:HEAT repeat protein